MKLYRGIILFHLSSLCNLRLAQPQNMAWVIRVHHINNCKITFFEGTFMRRITLQNKSRVFMIYTDARFKGYKIPAKNRRKSSSSNTCYELLAQ